MKKLFFFVLLCIAFSANSQNKKPNKGYGLFGFTFFGSEKFDKSGGVVLGGGFSPFAHMGIGGGVNAYIFSKGEKFGQLFSDFRVFINSFEEEGVFYVTLQPGVILYNKDYKVGPRTFTTNGSFAINAMLGAMFRKSNQLGFFINVGYSNIQFSTKSNTGSPTHSKYGGIRADLGIAF